MEPLIGTPQCPHLGYSAQDGLPCCHADAETRTACGKQAPNPKARGMSEGAANTTGIEPYYCSVLGKDQLPAESLKLAAQEKARNAQPGSSRAQGYQKPGFVTGHQDAAPSREQDLNSDQPVIPTHTLRSEEARVGPNDRCPCGSGKKFKKCCGRGG